LRTRLDQVRGKDTAFSVYQLIGEKSTASAAELAFLAQYEAGLERYRAAELPPPKSSGAASASIPIPAVPRPSPPLVMAGAQD
jgi:hypothetical protein